MYIFGAHRGARTKFLVPFSCLHFGCIFIFDFLQSLIGPNQGFCRLLALVFMVNLCADSFDGQNPSFERFTHIFQTVWSLDLNFFFSGSDAFKKLHSDF